MTDLANTPSIDPEKKEWIDQAPYAELLDKWRHDPLGSEWFQGDVGDYFKTKLDESDRLKKWKCSFKCYKSTIDLCRFQTTWTRS